MDRQRSVAGPVVLPVARPVARQGNRLVASAGPPSLSGTLPNPTNGVAYNQSLTLSGGTAPFTYSVSAGALPAGLSLNTSTGAITGTPTGYGDATFTIQVVDATAQSATSAQAITVYGPELISSITDGSWTINLQSGAAGTVTQDGTGFHWAGANNLAGVFKSITTVDNAVYEVTYTRSGSSLGGSKFIVYGATTAHSGQSSTRTTDGSFTERVTCNAAGSNALQFRFQATGTSPNNTFNVTSLSCRRVG